MAPGSFHYNWYIRVLTAPGPDADLSLFVAFDHERYLFGSGEGTQRAFTQHKVSTRGLSAVFIGDGGSKGRSGLPGVLMTAADVGIPKVDIVGPPDITHYLATLRTSVYRKDLQVNARPHPSNLSSDEADNIYNSPFLNVRSIALRPDPGPSYFSTEFNAPPISQTGSAAQTQDVAVGMISNMFRTETKSDADPTKKLCMPSAEETSTHMVYICKAPPVPGKFDNAKATALKVPNGPQRSQLVKGSSIEFPDPTDPSRTIVVKPEDVVGGGMEGATIIVVNCSKETLPGLLKSPIFHAYQPQRDPAPVDVTGVALVVHRVSTAVWQDPAYLEWIKAYGPDTQHLIADTDHYRNDILFNSSAWNTLQLSLLDGDIFPLPLSSTLSLPDTLSLPSNVTMVAPYHQQKLYPAGPLQQLPHFEKDIPYPRSIDAVHEARRNLLKTMPEFAVECAKARAAVRSDPRWGKKEGFVGEDIVVTTLGTGSALPSKYRNVSSTHLDIPQLGGILLDAGEGTLGQLRRRYGEGIKKIYDDLKVIFISHMHADHHLGLQAVLEDRFKHGVTSKLYLIAPVSIANSLSESGPWSYSVPQEALDQIVWIDNQLLEKGPLPGVEASYSDTEDDKSRAEKQQQLDSLKSIPVATSYQEGWRRWPSREILFNGFYRVKHSQDAIEEMKKELGLVGVKVVKMIHRGKAWGLVLHHSSGWKAAYSGDTIPCPAFIRAGKGATLVIHEATLEDDKPDVASEKGHSTFSQAIEVGQKMRASHTLLNHFSQRYPKVPKSRQKQDEQNVVSISFDLMSVRVGDMWRMKYYLDAVSLLFQGEEDDDDITGAVKKDFNPTLDKTIGTRGGGAKAGKNGRKAQPLSGQPSDQEARKSVPPKRQTSPSHSAPQGKKSKSESSEGTAPLS